MTVSTIDYRTVMGHFATGVTVVTALDGDRPQGITVNALASVSLEPPLVMVALARTRFIVPTIDATRRYAINVLAEGPAVAVRLLRRGERDPQLATPSAALPWHPGALGLPILDGAIASLECEVAERVTVGDHHLYVGRVEACAEGDAEAPPLLYHRRRYLRIERATTAQLVGKPESPAG